MKLSLQARVAIVVTLIIVAMGSLSTYRITSAYSRSMERNRLMRGETLAYTLSKAAEEGLLKENLNLLRKAANVIQAPDVALVQVYSTIWNCIDAHPFERFGDPPLPAAVEHFRISRDPAVYTLADSFEFYNPILFQPSEEGTPVVIGYVRLSMSSLSARREIRQLLFTNILISAAVMILAIILITTLIRRLVVRPVLKLHNEMSAFRSGLLPDALTLSLSAPYELRDLEQEFHDLCRSIRDKEQKLIESGRRIRDLFERAEHGIFRFDRKGSIMEANSRFRDLFGPVTFLCDILMGEQGTDECLKQAASMTVLNREENAVGRGGKEIRISLSLYPERDASGSVTGYDGYIIDITERMHFQERLIRAQKLEAVGTLAGGMAHDFNNLLTAILGYSEIILSQTKEGDPFHRPVSIIYEAATRGAEFGRKILSMTSRQRLELTPVDLNEVVKNSVELLRRSMPRDIDIVTSLYDGLPMATADSSQMQQVIINLAANASDAMPTGGKLTIETAPAPSAEGIAGAPEGTGSIRLSVSDTGRGIDKETQAKIFDPFFTTKEVGKGTGLGLYIVHSIVQNHGGYINVYSESGRGTRFNVYLPVTKVAVAEASREQTDLTGSGTILVIDDEPRVRELCKDILERLGYSVLLADGGISGINLFRERRGDIAVVVLDMIMPGMGGTEVFRSIRTIDPDAKILLYSGYTHESFAGINELLKEGAAGFIQKPFSSRDIGLAINKVLSGRP
jgi:signal transduction histidine kinase/ActR/RegA family two-component response regulator